MNQDYDQNKKKFQRRESILVYVTILTLASVPILFIFALLSQHNNPKLYRTMEILLMLSVTLIISVVLLRRCPYCKKAIGRYHIFPKKCPHCSSPLK